jgi:hypothetical protein
MSDIRIGDKIFQPLHPQMAALDESLSQEEFETISIP